MSRYLPTDKTPNPKYWPVCDSCNVPYVLRLCYLLSDEREWLWQRDCKHKTAGAHVGSS